MQTKLPGAAGKTTSRLGLGIATLMREGSQRKRDYVFDAAYDCGIRHFDVAPLYGLGRAEPVLGRLLLRTEGDVTIASKFGLRPSQLARTMGRLQRPLRFALERSTTLKHLARSYKGSSIRQVAPQVQDVIRSLDLSHRELGVDGLDLLLMHDMEWDREWIELWNGLSTHTFESKTPGLGVSCASSEDPDPLGVLTERNVLQVPGSIFSKKATSKDPLKISFGLFARELSPAISFLDGDPQARSYIEELVGLPVRTPSEVASLLASISLAKDGRSILLIGTTKSSHVTEVWNGVESILPAVQNNVRDLLRHLSPIQMPLREAPTK